MSARAATDMFRLFGGALFGENSDATQNTTAATSTRRRLFRMSTDHSSMELAKFGCDDIVEILVGMLDDEVSISVRPGCIVNVRLDACFRMTRLWKRAASVCAAWS